VAPLIRSSAAWPDGRTRQQCRWQYPPCWNDISLKGWDAVVRTNLYAPFIVSLACFKAWFKHHGGSIVSVPRRLLGVHACHGSLRRGTSGDQELHRDCRNRVAAAAVRVNAVAAGMDWSRSL